MKKKTVKKKHSRVAVKTPTFPSRFKIGQEVILDFWESGKLKANSVISAVTFTEGKVYYDVDVLVYPASKDEYDNYISYNRQRFITLKEVDSICVEPIKK